MNFIAYFISETMANVGLLRDWILVGFLWGGAFMYFVAQLLINLLPVKRIFKLMPISLFSVDILYFCIRAFIAYLNDDWWDIFLMVAGISVIYSLIAIGIALLISFVIKFIIKKLKDRNLAINE